MELHTGDIIRFRENDIYRDWILVHWTHCSPQKEYKPKGHSKDHTGFYCFGGPWYPGDWMTSEPYGKGGFELTVGSLNHMRVVGNLNNIDDYHSYKLFEKASDFISDILKHKDEEIWKDYYTTYKENIALFEGKKRDKQRWSI